MTQLLIFGDSWAAGSELRPGEKTFGEILSSKLGMICNNFSFPSSSIPNLIGQLQAAGYLNHSGLLKGSTAIFFLTSPHRDFIYSADGQYQQIYTGDESDLSTWWYKHVHTSQLAEFRVNTVLLALRQICEVYGINDRYIWGWEKVNVWPEIDRNRFFEQGSKTCLDLFDDIKHDSINDYANNPQNLYVSPNICHPNQLGHEKIADALYEWIEKCPKMSKPS
jgi:hypothetical protein